MKNEETVDYIASREGVCKMENFLACLYALKTQFTERIIDRGETENNLEQESKVKVLVTQSYPTLATPWTVAHQAPLSMELSRQEYCSGMPFPSSGDLLKPGIKPSILHCRQMLYHLSYQGSPFQFTWTPPNSSVL